MSLTSKFMDVFNKRQFDYTDPNITIDSFHPQIRTIFAINGLWFNNRDSKLRFLWPFVCTGISVVAVFFEAITLIHALSIEDPALFTAAFAYGVIIGVVPFLYYSLLKNPSTVRALIDAMDKDIKYICNEIGDPYKTKFLEGQLRIWQCGLIWFVFVVFVASMYILISVLAIMYYCLFATHDENTGRPLIFPLWLPNDDPRVSPNYEILMLMMYTIIVIFVTTFTAYVYIIFHLWLHAYYKMDVVILALEHLFDDLDERVVMLDYDDERYIECEQELKNRLRRIVTWHNGVFNLVKDTLNIFGVTIGYQVIFSSIVMCLMAFYITVQLEEGKFDICISLLSVGALLQLWIPCYIGSLLRSKGFEVANSCFYSGWHASKLVKIILTDLTIIIIRSQHAITIQITCLPVLQLETFSSILSTAYSYFNMLQQGD